MKAKEHPLYATWCNMKARCSNTQLPNYKNYGARGITVSPEWENFWAFASDMGIRPPGTSLERKDNDKGYSKDNCCWATRKEQAANTRPQQRFGRPRMDTQYLSGVRYYKGSFYAKATVNGSTVNLYSGKCLLEAASARKSFESRGGVL